MEALKMQAVHIHSVLRKQAGEHFVSMSLESRITHICATFNVVDLKDMY